MGGQRRGGAAAGSRKTSGGERRSGQKAASGQRRGQRSAPRDVASKPRKTVPPKVDPNYNAGSLAEEISAIVEAVVPPAAPQVYDELETEANALLADSTPTIKSAAIRRRPQKRDGASEADAAPPSADSSASPGSSPKHRTLSSMSGAWNRADIHSTTTPTDSTEANPAVSESPGQHAEKVSLATRPVATVSAPLRPHVASQSLSRRSWAPPSGPVATHHPLPEADLVVPTAAVHTALAVVAAGAAAVFALQGQSELAVSALLLTGILGVGAGLAYTFADTFASRRAGGAILIVAELGALWWSFLLIGYRPSLLLLIPGLVVLAMRMSGRLAGLLMATGAALLYCGSSWASFNGYFQPRLPLDGGTLLFIDTAVVLVGIACLAWSLLDLHDSQTRALAFARAKRYESANLREQLSKLRRETEDDAEELQAALGNALTGDATKPPTLRGILSPLSEAASVLAERIQTLQRDREERVRLEGALHRMILAAQRKHLGLPWNWPQESGTLADELIAVLPGPKAAPRPGTLEKELESLAQVSEFDLEELSVRSRVPSWPRPAIRTRTLANAPQTRKRPAYLRPVDTFEDADTPLSLPLPQDDSSIPETQNAGEP